MATEIPRWRQRFADNQEARAWNVTSLLMTLPLLLIGFYYYGGQALRSAAGGVIAAVLCEVVAGRLILKRRTVDDWNAVVTGIWVACMLPADMLPGNAAPLYAALGAAFAVLVVKIPFGGTMHAPFTPAAAGFAFLTVCFPHRVFAFTPSVEFPPAYKASLASMLQNGRSVLSGKQLTALLLGQSAGPMGTGGILVIATALLAMLLLNRQRRSAACSSLGFLGAVAFIAFVFPRVLVNPLNPLQSRIESIGMELCAGSLSFAAVYLLPDPAVMPRRWFTRLGFGAIAGALAMLMRHIGSYEESVCFAVLLADAAVPMLYRLKSELRNQKEFRDRIHADDGEVVHS